MLKSFYSKVSNYISEKKRAKYMNKRDKERCNCNKIDILLYDANKVTLEDCITMQEKYGLRAVIDSGIILGFTSE